MASQLESEHGTPISEVREKDRSDEVQLRAEEKCGTFTHDLAEDWFGNRRRRRFLLPLHWWR
jgi:hypothetical protein